MVQAAEESATGSLSVIDALTACLSSGLFMAGSLILTYAVALLDQVGYYLYLLRHEEGLLAKEARLTVEDAKLQWSHYRTYIKELVSTDRQLKFLEIWNQAVGGKGQFSGLFDINSYVKEGEDSLFPDNIPLLRKWEAKQEEHFALLRTALGFSRLVPAEPYPSDAREYRDGFQCECIGRNYMVAKEYYASMIFDFRNCSLDILSIYGTLSDHTTAIGRREIYENLDPKAR